MITLSIASVVNGIFTFTSQIISRATLGAEIAKCMKLQEQNNLTSNITSSSDSYSFYGAKPSELGYLSVVTSNIQGQLNNITSNYLLSSTAINLYQPKGNYLLNSDFITTSTTLYNYIYSLSGIVNNDMLYCVNIFYTLASNIYFIY